MSAKNKVIAGDYSGYKIITKNFQICIDLVDNNLVILLNKKNIENYEIITEDKVKSSSTAILRGMAGVALFGGIGVLAGLSAKNKGIYTIAIQWTNGKRSLIEIDDKLYKKFIADMF